jgi:hypothetical protein
MKESKPTLHWHTGEKENAMSEQVRQTESSGMVKAVSVADYIVDRLAAEDQSLLWRCRRLRVSDLRCGR